MNMYHKALRKVDLKREYNITEMMRDRLFWWVGDIRSYRKIIKAAKHVLSPVITGSGKGARYKIKGRNISRFIKEYGPGIEFITQLNTHDNTSDSKN